MGRSRIGAAPSDVTAATVKNGDRRVEEGLETVEGRQSTMPATRPEPSDREAGFSLIEVLFAMAIFTIVVTVALGVVVRTAGAAAGNSRRVVAAGLAARQIESARSLQATLIPDGAQIHWGKSKTLDEIGLTQELLAPGRSAL